MPLRFQAVIMLIMLMQPWRHGAAVAGSTFPCNSGYYYSPNTKNNECIECTAGSFQTASKSGVSACTLCSQGTYQPSQGMSACYLCAVGTYNDILEATICSSCSIGTSTFNSNGIGAAGQTACSACAPGQYIGKVNNDDQCLDCPSSGSFCQAGSIYPCTTPINNQQFIISACNNTHDAVIKNCSMMCASTPNGSVTMQYISTACTSTQDSQCSPCSTCPFMIQYAVSQCSGHNDTVCAPCNKSKGDFHVGGKCNPCPAGAYLQGAPGNQNNNCTLCPAKTFSLASNSLVCQACPPGTTSAVGATRCVADCSAQQPPGYAPDGENCVPPSTAQSLLTAYDPSFSQIQAVALTSVTGQFLIARVVFASTHMLYMLGAGSSWLFAGSVQTDAIHESDGVGEEASFQVITDIIWDYESDAYWVIETTESSSRWRWVTAQANVTTLNFPTTSIQITGWTAIFSGQKMQFWVIPSSYSSYTMWLIELNPRTRVSSILQQWDSGLFQTTLPLLGLQLSSVEGVITRYFLFEGSIVSFEGNIVDNAATGTQVCGSEGGLLLAQEGQSALCTEVDLASMGAIDFVFVSSSLFYILFYNSVWSGIGAVAMSEGQWSLTLVWIQTDGTNGRSNIPMKLLLGLDGSLFLADQQGSSYAQIWSIGVSGCLCSGPGLFCGSEGQCVEAPLGTEVVLPWTSIPIPCPQGSIRQSNELTCVLCPENFTTTGPGAWFCQSSCPDHLFLLYPGDYCVSGCNGSLGLYHDMALGQCQSCWLGSWSSGGIGMSGSCQPCPIGQYGASPGICKACPIGTSTATYGATVCMPTIYIACSDGQNSMETLAECALDTPHAAVLPPPVNVPLLVLPNGTLFMLASSEAEKSHQNTVGVFCRSCNNTQNVFFTFVEESCIYARTTQDPIQKESAVFTGVCGQPGLLSQGLLPAIYGLAIMEYPQHTPILYVTVMLAYEEGTPPCVEVYAVSTYDGSTTYFMSQNILSRPVILLTQCIEQPLVLASAPSTGTLYAAMGSALFSAQVLGDGNAPGNLFQLSPIYQVDAGSISFINVFSSGHCFLGTSAGQIYSIPPSAFTDEGVPTVVVNAKVAWMGAAGRHVFFQNTTTSGSSMSQIVFSNVQECIAGYVLTGDEGICMQAGRGYYTSPDSAASLQSCPPGTYGPQAGGMGCVQCPPGSASPTFASAVCVACPPGTFSSEDRTQCFASCPAGTRPNAQGSCMGCGPGFILSLPTSSGIGSCTPCPAGTFSSVSSASTCQPCPTGYTSPPGAHSCVIQCAEAEQQCAYDGQNCISLTNNYRTLSQIHMENSGGRILGLAVDRNGGFSIRMAP